MVKPRGRPPKLAADEKRLVAIGFALWEPTTREALSLRKADIALLWFCPALASLGGLAGALFQLQPLSILPSRAKLTAYAQGDVDEVTVHFILLGFWVALRGVAGAVIGLVLALYMAGNEMLAALTPRLMGLSVVLGMVAPKVLGAQDRAAEILAQKYLRKLDPPKSDAPVQLPSGVSE